MTNLGNEVQWSLNGGFSLLAMIRTTRLISHSLGMKYLRQVFASFAPRLKLLPVKDLVKAFQKPWVACTCSTWAFGNLIDDHIRAVVLETVGVYSLLSCTLDLRATNGLSNCGSRAILFSTQLRHSLWISHFVWFYVVLFDDVVPFDLSVFAVSGCGIVLRAEWGKNMCSSLEFTLRDFFSSNAATLRAGR